MDERIGTIVKESGTSAIAEKMVTEVRYGSYATLGTAVEFCEYYGCSLDYLVGRSDIYSVI